MLAVLALLWCFFQMYGIGEYKYVSLPDKFGLSEGGEHNQAEAEGVLVSSRPNQACLKVSV